MECIQERSGHINTDKISITSHQQSEIEESKKSILKLDKKYTGWIVFSLRVHYQKPQNMSTWCFSRWN